MIDIYNNNNNNNKRLPLKKNSNKKMNNFVEDNLVLVYDKKMKKCYAYSSRKFPIVNKNNFVIFKTLENFLYFRNIIIKDNKKNRGDNT